MQDPESFRKKFLDAMLSSEIDIDLSEVSDRKIAYRTFEFREHNKRYKYTLEVSVEFNWRRFFSTGEKSTYALAKLHDKSGEEFSYIIDIQPTNDFILEGVNMSEISKFKNEINRMVNLASLEMNEIQDAINNFREQVQGFNQSLAERGV